MITRDEIRSIPDLYKSIQRDKEQLRFLREKATSVPSSLSDRERVQTSPDNDQMRYVEAATDLDDEIQLKESLLIDLQQRAKVFIDSLPCATETEKLTKRILKLRYLKCWKWEELATVVGYAERYIRQLESDSFKNLLPPPVTSGV